MVFFKKNPNKFKAWEELVFCKTQEQSISLLLIHYAANAHPNANKLCVL